MINIRGAYFFLWPLNDIFWELSDKIMHLLLEIVQISIIKYFYHGAELIVELRWACFKIWLLWNLEQLSKCDLHNLGKAELALFGKLRLSINIVSSVV